MDDLLKKASIQNKIDADVVSEILDIERKNVYKKRRFIFGDLKKLIEDNSEAEVMQKCSLLKFVLKIIVPIMERSFLISL